MARLRWSDVVIFGIIAIAIIVMATFIVHKLSLKHEVSQARTTVADKVVTALSTQNTAALRTLGDSSFQSKNSASALDKTWADLLVQFFFVDRLHDVFVAIGKDNVQLVHEVLYLAVFQRLLAAAVVRHHAADGAELAAGGVARMSAFCFSVSFSKSRLEHAGLGLSLGGRDILDLGEVGIEIHDDRFVDGTAGHVGTALRAVTDRSGVDFFLSATSLMSVCTSLLSCGITTSLGRSSNMLASWLYFSLASALSSSSPLNPFLTKLCLKSSISLKLIIPVPNICNSCRVIPAKAGIQFK
ncbi:MAG: hypothetical protein WDN27_06725 [Candidatus Saccharibacteria bacterium]